jgi:hypothetical protein
VTVAGTTDAIVHCDACVDDTGPVIGMMVAYGDNGFLVQDGATCHTSRDTMGYLSECATVLVNSLSGSPDLNSIEDF